MMSCSGRVSAAGAITMMQVMTVMVMMLMITSIYVWMVAAHPCDGSDVKKGERMVMARGSRDESHQMRLMMMEAMMMVMMVMMVACLVTWLMTMVMLMMLMTLKIVLLAVVAMLMVVMMMVTVFDDDDGDDDDDDDAGHVRTSDMQERCVSRRLACHVRQDWQMWELALDLFTCVLPAICVRCEYRPAEVLPGRTPIQRRCASNVWLS